MGNVYKIIACVLLSGCAQGMDPAPESIGGDAPVSAEKPSESKIDSVCVAPTGIYLVDYVSGGCGPTPLTVSEFDQGLLVTELPGVVQNFDALICRTTVAIGLESVDVTWNGDVGTGTFDNGRCETPFAVRFIKQ